MKQKLICGLLCLGLCLPSALAAENTFTDVKDTDWFAPYVSVCAESGLMNGTGNGSFSPGGTMTVAECAAIAARLLESSTGKAIPGITALPGETLPWYQQYVGYLTSNGVSVPEPTKIATRQEFFDLLAAVTAPEQLPAINSITSLPDTGDEHVLAFYNAGILTGTDDYGTFSGEKTLSRSEVAAMVARLVKSELRLPFTPQEKEPAPSVPPVSETAPGQAQDGDAVMTVNGHTVSSTELIRWLNVAAYQTDSLLASRYGIRLDLSDPDMMQTIMTQAQLQAAAQVLAAEKARELNCEVSELAAAMTPSPTPQELEGYVKENDLLCAKHILVADEQTAQAVLDGLEAQPTLDQFNALLYVFGSDPGMESNPEGYLFSSGEMVEEFESGTRALAIGAYTAEPVKSTYGYHIIWRLDPLGHPDLVGQFQQAVLEQRLNTWIQSADITVNTAALEQIDVAGNYSAFLLQLFGSQQ